MTSATHSHTVQLIRSSGDAICLKIITPPRRGVQHHPRLPVERVAVSWRQEPRLSTASNGGPSKDLVQRAANKASSRVVKSSHTTVENRAPGQQLTPRISTGHSMPDLTAAADNRSVPDHTDRCRKNDSSATGKASDDCHERSGADYYRDRLLYELTNQLRPSSVVVQPSSSPPQRADDDRPRQTRPEVQSSDEPTRHPAPPPPAASHCSRLHATTPTVGSLTAPTATSTGSELKEMLVVSGHATETGREERCFSNNSPSSTTRSVISEEHLVVPSQLKKLQRSPTSDQTSKQDNVDDSKTIQDAVKLNGHHSSVPAHHTAVNQHRSPVPKRPAPPPPTCAKLIASPATNEEVNFLVMAEQARKQYILSKLARQTLTANNEVKLCSASAAVNDQHWADFKQANDQRLHKAVNGSTHCADINGTGQFMANGESPEHLHMSVELHNPISLPQTDVEGSHAVHQTDNESSPAQPLRSAWQDSETSPAAPALPPKRRPRHQLQIQSRNDDTPNAERQNLMTSNVDENGTDAIRQSHVTAAKMTDVKFQQEALHGEDCSDEASRKSNAKLIRGKNVLIRRSGASRLSSPANHNLATHDEHSTANGNISYKDAEMINHELCDVGVLPPPPEFAD